MAGFFAFNGPDLHSAKISPPMEKSLRQTTRQRSWTVPISVLLHVAVIGVFYFQWPETPLKPAEPDSVSVELVELPKEEAPPEAKKAEEAKKPEPPPPPPVQTPQQPTPPSAPSPAMLPPVVLRPEETQVDEKDQPGRQEDTGGEAKPEPSPSKQSEADTKADQPTVEQNDAKDEPLKAAMEGVPQAATGEIAAAETQSDQLAAVVPTPKPEVDEKKSETQKKAPGSGDPKLKPARKILSGPTLADPMSRQFLAELPPEKRLVQLCTAEALAQIFAARAGQRGPGGVTTGEGRVIRADALDAPNGAFNVGSEWYPINFRCEADLDNYAVTGFSYNIGSKLSASEAKRRRLPAL